MPSSLTLTGKDSFDRTDQTTNPLFVKVLLGISPLMCVRSNAYTHDQMQGADVGGAFDLHVGGTMTDNGRIEVNNKTEKKYSDAFNVKVECDNWLFNVKSTLLTVVSCLQVLNLVEKICRMEEGRQRIARTQVGNPEVVFENNAGAQRPWFAGRWWIELVVQDTSTGIATLPSCCDAV